MAKGITVDCAALWAFIRKDGGWWSVLRLTRHWAPTYSLGEVEEILATLHKGDFLECQTLHRAGTVYAVTSNCLPLPGASTSAPAAHPAPAMAPTRPDAMRGAFVPSPMPTSRPGALDHTHCPSLMQGKRNAYRSTTT
ncbi:hypothetical protein [Acidovorax sp.]|uniref:hypothetical protein n=1 Tax=Acidovorax sp. TaxID=1872122 RepID=UPI0027BADE6B|nr:hypothetical protein [Acidovorax sp.]